MKYETAVIKLETHSELFSFDNVRPFCNNVFGRDLMTNEAYIFDYPELTAYNYLMSNCDDSIYTDGQQKRAFARLVNNVILANGPKTKANNH